MSAAAWERERAEMGVAEELGDDLARRTLEAMKDIDDDRFFYQVAKVIGASSPTLEEAYLTAMRIRLAAARGHKFLDDALKARRAGGPIPLPPPDNAAH